MTVPSSANTTPRPGDVLVLPEADYRYGPGPVVARVTVVHGPVEYRGEPWWLLSADVACGQPERHGGFQDRHLYVRGSTVGRNRRSAEGGAHHAAQ